MAGHSANEFLYSEDLENVRDMMRQSRRGNVTRHFDCRYLHKNGEPVVLTWTGVWAEEEKQYFFIGRDITDARRLEAIERDLEEISGHLRGWPEALVILRSTAVYILIETLLIANSAWACFVLLRPPSNFRRFPGTFDFALRITSNETVWGLAFGTTATIMALGLTCIFCSFCHKVATSVRCVGLAISGACWVIMGASTVAGNPDTLFGMGGALDGLISFGIALRLALLL